MAMHITDRQHWLMSEVSSMGRLTIGTEQYEELRALAKALYKRNKEVDRTDTPEDIDDQWDALKNYEF